MNVNKLLCLALLCTAGCAGTNKTTMMHGEALTPEAAAMVAEDGGPPGIQGWIPGIFDDMWDTVSINVGTGYGAGAHFALTNLLRVGVGEYADFGVIGVERGIFEGNWDNPIQLTNDSGEAVYDLAVWDLSAKFGVGWGMHFAVHTAQVFDLFSSVVGFV